MDSNQSNPYFAQKHYLCVHWPTGMWRTEEVLQAFVGIAGVILQRVAEGGNLEPEWERRYLIT